MTPAKGVSAELSDLERRQALPDGMAHLLPRYPRAGWRAHVGFGPMTQRWLMMHDSLRGSGEALAKTAVAFRNAPADSVRFHQAFRPLAERHFQHLQGHHQIEDEALFPQFRRLDVRLGNGLDVLESDHEAIHEALIRSVDGINRLLRSLVSGGDAMRFALDGYLADAAHLDRLLDRHLHDEEEIVVPTLLHHGEAIFL